ncbi:MAG: M24 family metallopeptidase [Pseudomonadota bacterium]
MTEHCSQQKLQKRLHFSVEEYSKRLLKTRTAMEKKGIDVLMVTDPSNMNWLSGYDGWSFYVHQCILVTPDSKLLWFGREQDARGAQKTVYMDDEDVLFYPDHYVQSDFCHPMDVLSEILQQRGYAKKQIGVEMDNYYYSARAHQRLEQGLPNAKLIDATGVVNWQRIQKSPRELFYMYRAGKLVARMHKKAQEVVKPGLRKCDLAGFIYQAALEQMQDGEGVFGGDYAAIVPLMPSGKDASAPHLTWDERPLIKGEGFFLELAGCHRRYHCSLSRTFFLGRPTSVFMDAEKAVNEGIEAGLEVAKIGNYAEDIAIAYQDILSRYHIEKTNRAGYSIGLSYPPDWGERTVSLRAGDKTVLAENMTFHFMTGLWMEEWGFEITESIVITKDGPKCLADFDRQLVVVD